MRRIFVWSVIAAMAIVLPGCGKATHESLTKDTVSQMKKVVEILKGVKDEASAKAAASKIEAIGKAIRTIKTQAEELGKPTRELEAQLQDKYAEELRSVTMEMGREVMRIQMDPKLRGPMREGMMALEKAAK